MAKKRSRIRQTKTSFQKAFEGRKDLLQPVSWIDRMPEFLHLGMTIGAFGYEATANGFAVITDAIRRRYSPDSSFHFTLSEIVFLYEENKDCWKVIEGTKFEPSLRTVGEFYGYFGLEGNLESLPKDDIFLFFTTFKEMSHPKSTLTILAKHTFLKCVLRKSSDPFGITSLTLPKDILSHSSGVNAMFLAVADSLPNINIEFCTAIWYFNYGTFSPVFTPDSLEEDTKIRKDMMIPELKNELDELVQGVKGIELLTYYPRPIAEVYMGFLARICNLSIKVIDFVMSKEDEIARLTLRSTLETYILFSWLHKRKNPEDIIRFREFSAGREKFTAQSLQQMAKGSPLEKTSN